MLENCAFNTCAECCHTQVFYIPTNLERKPTPLTHTYTQPWQWQSRKQAKMTQKHIQAKASTDKLCETRLNQRYSPIKKKQHNLGSLSSLHCWKAALSDIYSGPTSCLIVTLLFNVLFLWYFPLFYLPSLSIYSRSANISPVHLNRALSSL